MFIFLYNCHESMRDYEDEIYFKFQGTKMMIFQRILTKMYYHPSQILIRRLSVRRKGDTGGGTKHPSKKTKKRGPKVVTVKIKPYHLPPCSAKSRFNNFSCLIVKRHIEMDMVCIDGLQLHVFLN